jgi:hypothetical protein
MSKMKDECKEATHGLIKELAKCVPKDEIMTSALGGVYSQDWAINPKDVGGEKISQNV